MSWLICPDEKNGFLDLYPGAAAAYSVRNLNGRSGVSSPVVRVRRSSDNTEADFTATEVSDGTLAAWVGAGNDGFVRTWYDQSGNGNDVEALETANQPKIIIAGSLVTENGKAAIAYDNDLLQSTISPITNTSNYFVTTVYRIDSQQDANPRYFAMNLAGNSVNIQFGHNTDSKYFSRAVGSTALTSDAYTVLGSANLLSWGASSGVLSFSRNGTADAFSDSGAPTADSSLGDGFYIFKGYLYTSFYSDTGTIQEFIVYNSSQSSNRTAIEANINAHYSIF